MVVDYPQYQGPPDEWYLHHTYVDPDQVEIVEDNVFVNEGNAPLNDLGAKTPQTLQLIDQLSPWLPNTRSLKDRNCTILLRK